MPASGPDVAPARSPIEPARARSRRSPLVALGAALAVVAGIAAVAFMAFSPDGTTAQGSTAAAQGHAPAGGALPGQLPGSGSSGNSTSLPPLPTPSLPDLPVPRP